VGHPVRKPQACGWDSLASTGTKDQRGRWYREARGTEASGRDEGSLNILIVPVESRET